MSRIGKMPVTIPAGVEVKVDDSVVTVKGPKGTLTQAIEDKNVTVDVEAGKLTVKIPENAEKEQQAMHGLYRALIANMVTGVTAGFTKGLEIVGVGYRANADSATKLTINIGYSHPVIVEAPANITFATPDANHITVTGIDKQAVGQVAAELRSIRKPEPYHGKGIRYQGEFVRHKEGKAGKK